MTQAPVKPQSRTQLQLEFITNGLGATSLGSGFAAGISWVNAQTSSTAEGCIPYFVAGAGFFGLLYGINKLAIYLANQKIAERNQATGSQPLPSPA